MRKLDWIRSSLPDSALHHAGPIDSESRGYTSHDGDWYTRRERVYCGGRLAWRWALYQLRPYMSRYSLLAHYRTLLEAKLVPTATAAWMG